MAPVLCFAPSQASAATMAVPCRAPQARGTTVVPLWLSRLLLLFILILILVATTTSSSTPLLLLLLLLAAMGGNGSS